MWSGRVRLISPMIAASVVDLPEPVSPVTSTSPFWYETNSPTTGGRPSSESLGMPVASSRIEMAYPPLTR